MTIALSGYKIIAPIYESANSLVYRSIREQDGLSAILKVLKPEYPTLQELTQYKQEYEILRNLNLDGVVKAYGLEPYGRRLVIILEDFGGESLNLELRHRRFTVDEFLKIALQIAEILSKIHGANIIHKDINPSNIIINPKNRKVKLIDFGLSTVLNRENPMLKNPNVLEGTLAYISPEQTGRMNRALDYRTDFYSLGVTLYELLTQTLPFETTDPLELVHFHIAKTPVPPHEIKPEVPKTISKIVMKLLAKNAEDRYQSGFGLKNDLKICWNQLKTQKYISEFILASQDISNKFKIPQKLYGREKEIQTLITAFDGVTQGKSEMMLVTGSAGMGKSALVAEIHKPITQKRGYFISGKFDRYQRNIPYMAVIQAFQELIKQLLTESEAGFQKWRDKILEAMGSNGKVIIDIIPELELLIGAQPPVPKLPGSESKNRLSWVFQNFIKVFAKPEHPLVIFLDDLQWADMGSLKLMQLLMTADIRFKNTDRSDGKSNQKSLFLIGAYRDNEVNSAHPLMLMLNEIEQAGVRIDRIHLSPLNQTQIDRLISDTLKCTTERSETLAELVAAKTNGNPFFVNEFFKKLYTENLINFKRGYWLWDLENIKRQGFTDNVVELMTENIKKLQKNTQQVLKLAACIGNPFELETVSIIYKKSLKETAIALREAMTVGLIFPLSDAYKSVELDVITRSDELVKYKFVHDRIQQAAYSLIPDSQKPIIHKKVGEMLLQKNPQDKLESKLFDIVNQLNLGIKLMTLPEEKVDLAHLNLRAGHKAKSAAAYEPAFKYLKTGTELLEKNSWKDQYNLTLSLYVEAAEAAYMSADFEQMEKLSTVVLKNAVSTRDKVKVYEVQIQALQAQNQLKEAVEIGIKVLTLLGVKLPKQISKINVFLELIETKFILWGNKIDDLMNLPAITDREKQLAIRLLFTVSSVAYLAVPELVPLIVFKSVKLSVKYGNSAVSADAYASYGVILCAVLGDIETGYQFGKLALKLIEQLNSPELKAKIFLVFNDLIRHWKEHLRETLAPLLDAYKSGLETGDLEFAALSANAYCYHSYLCGKELEGLAQEMAGYREAIAKIKQQTTLNLLEIWYQSVLNLRTISDNPHSLIGNVYDEETMLPLHLEANDRTALFVLYFNKLFLSYLFEDYDRATQNSILTKKYLDGGLGVYTVVLFYFYDSLAKLSLFNNCSDVAKKIILLTVSKNQKKLQKWANHAPMNSKHKFYLVEAERCRVRGLYLKAMDYYDGAIELAQKHQYLNEEALAHELAAKFYLALGKIKLAQPYMKEAHYCYIKWGATAKVKDLEIRYPQLLAETQSTNKNTETTVTLTTGGSSYSIDLATVIKGSQAISGEILLENLLSHLMKISIENAGAQFGFLILETQKQMRIEASGHLDSNEVTVLQSSPISTVDDRGLTILPTTIVNYVSRTLDSVVLNDASRVGQFTQDPYIKFNQSKSILCAPLINQGQLSGIVYLENNLTVGAFTPDRIKLLNLLSTQAAISIKNARLYRNLEELNQSYERFVPRQFLQILNKESIIDVKLGDQIQQEMSVLFSDIRSFTTLSEQMTPEDNFKFINAYLSRMEPAIIENQGFIDKYIGDAIMALFSGVADNAVKAGISMLHRLHRYNESRQRPGRIPIRIGIGINTGSLMLGTVGGYFRMDGTVISDAVNLASRVESLTKNYGASLLITHQTLVRLQNSSDYQIRLIDRVKVKGKSELVTVYEVFDADPPELRDGKRVTQATFEEAWELYDRGSFTEAARQFEACLQINPDDRVAQIYLQRCKPES